MNTTFKILWFEDELAWYRMEELRIERILKEHYLQLQIDRKDGDDFNIQELIGNDYDLILMDFQLAEGITGDTIVAEIRNSNILTDILFYSSAEQNMIKAINRNMPPIDGVYLTKRDYDIFTEKVKNIINKIVKRSEDIVNLRGFVLDHTSDFELRIKEILNICWQKFRGDEKEKIQDALKNVLSNKRKWTEKQNKEIEEADCPFEYSNNNNYLLSISDRLDIMSVAINILFSSYNMTEKTCPKHFREYYKENLNVYRNKLGHINLGENTININGNIVEINQELHRLLRKNIASIDTLIGNIENHITKSL